MEKYISKTWLNNEDSFFTDHIVCGCKENKYDDNIQLDMFVRLGDCHKSACIHNEDDDIFKFTDKLKVMVSELNKFIDHLENMR